MLARLLGRLRSGTAELGVEADILSSAPATPAERFLARCSHGSAPDSMSFSMQQMMDELNGLSLEERAEIFRSAMDHPSTVTFFVAITGQSDPDHKISLLRRACTSVELPPDAACVAGWIDLLAGERWLRFVSWGKQAVAFFEKAKKAGSELDQTQRSKLMSYADALIADQAHTKADEAARAALYRRILKLLGEQPTDDGTLAKRVSERKADWHIRPESENFGFWVDFLCRVSDHFVVLRDEALAGSAAWIHDRDVFDRMFPPIRNMRHVFECWREPALIRDDFDGRDFNLIRGYAATGHLNPVDAATIRAIAASADHLRSFAAHEWDGDHLPAADILLGSGGADERALVLHILSAPDNARPPKTWLSKATQLATRIGKSETSDRLQAVLSSFAESTPDREKMKALTWWHWLAVSAIRLQEEMPELVSATEETIDGYARSLAFADLPRHTPEFPLRAVGLSYWSAGAVPSRTVRDEPVLYPGQDPTKAGTDRLDFYRKKAVYMPSLDNERALRGCVWLLSQLGDPDAVTTLEAVARSGTGFKVSDRYRSRVLANAAIAGLGAIGTPDALFAMARLRRSIRDKAVGNSVANAMTMVADKLGVTPADVEEMSVSDYGLGADARAAVPIGDWTAHLQLDDRGRVVVGYVDPAGKPVARPKRDNTFAEQHAAELADLKATAADLEGAVKQAKRRVEDTFRTGRDWALADWVRSYHSHPVVRTLAERLIWRFTPAEGAAFDALGTAPALTGIAGQPICPPSGPCRVRLWHPTMGDAATRSAWRELLLAAERRQPIFQAWRPVYEVTEPERRTRGYSNRFAALVLDQPVFVRILRNRGWILKSRMLGVSPEDCRPARLPLPAFGLVAEYWGRGVGPVTDNHEYGAPNFGLFATSQLRFYHASDVDRADATPVPLTELPAIAFSEAMLDLDLVSGVAAVGFDGAWLDPGLDAVPPPPEERAVDAYWNDDLTGRPASELGRTRAELLEWLVPRLAIGDRCRVDGHTLRVTGQWNEYSIHCTNAAVRIMGANRHVCIVPKGRDATAGIALPFAGDEVLALVLSKAFMLTDEDAIADQQIVMQLRT